ncbi:hypothetical protein CTAYLR_006631 [Chrysophaeum taylorii]|uniref:Nudix hydrolase domain-containing protein n=1 Tax=Chrysophaeum taylorii TaxID=2483200 RepID=A0AAD7UKV5_9STRA|nr:hypothetical protein CTAYLR_006631 [Chrysophaeum taylorii]
MRLICRFLPDHEYGLALDALVKGCADVLITRGSRTTELKILLGRRCVEPQPDWWFVGGRCRPGDTPQEGAARNVKRELGLSLSPARFGVVGSYSFVWRMRQQAPATNGTADISTVLELHLTDAEADSISIENFAESEYRDAKWTDPATVLEGDYSPALQQAVRDLISKHVFDDLRAAATAPFSPAFLLAKHARRLVAWYDATPTTAPVKVIYDADNELYNFVDPATGQPRPRHTKPLPAPAKDDISPARFYSSSNLRLLADAIAGPLLGAIRLILFCPSFPSAVLSTKALFLL